VRLKTTSIDSEARNKITYALWIVLTQSLFQLSELPENILQIQKDIIDLIDRAFEE
jgi:hypothetical protein